MSVSEAHSIWKRSCVVCGPGQGLVIQKVIDSRNETSSFVHVNLPFLFFFFNCHRLLLSSSLIKEIYISANNSDSWLVKMLRTSDYWLLILQWDTNTLPWRLQKHYRKGDEKKCKIQVIRRKTIKHCLMSMTQPTRSRTLNNWNYLHRPVQDWLKLQDLYPERDVLVEEIIVFSDVTTEIVVNFTPTPMWVELVKRSESQSKAKRHESPIGVWW